MLEKLKFWRRDEFQPMPEQPGPDPLARSDPFQQQFDLPQEGPDPYSQLRTPNYPQAQQFPGGNGGQPQQAFTQHQEMPRDRDTELILAKLDAIKSDVDAIGQRLRMLEQRTDPNRTPQRSSW